MNIKRLIQIIIIVLSIVVLSVVMIKTSGGTATYTVYPGGVPLSLADGIAAANPGDTILLTDGTYTSPVNPVVVLSGTAGNPVTFQAQNEGLAIIKSADPNYTDPNTVRHGFWFSGKSYITVDGIKFQGGFTGTGIKITNGNHIILENLTLLTMKSHGVSLYDSNSCTVEHCDISYSDSTGLYIIQSTGSVYAVKDNVITYNTVHHNGRSGIMVRGVGNTVTNNNSHHNGSIDPLDHGLYLQGGNNIVEDNTFVDNLFGNGIRVGYQGHLIQYNTCSRNGHSGIAVSGADPNTHDITIQYNTIEDNDDAGIRINSSQSLGNYPYGMVVYKNWLRRNLYNIYTGVGVRANITYNVCTDPDDVQMEILAISPQVQYDLLLERNNFFIYSGNCTFRVGGTTYPAAEAFPYMKPGDNVCILSTCLQYE